MCEVCASWSSWAHQARPSSAVEFKTHAAMDDHGHKGQGRIPKLGRNPLIRISHMMIYINLTAREFINLNPLSDRIFCIVSGNTYCTWVLGIIWYLSNPYDLLHPLRMWWWWIGIAYVAGFQAAPVCTHLWPNLTSNPHHQHHHLLLHHDLKHLRFWYGRLSMEFVKLAMYRCNLPRPCPSCSAGCLGE